MSDEFDFDALERELKIIAPAETLLERAASAWLEHENTVKRELLLACAETLDEILGETNASDTRVDVSSSKPGDGEVSVTIDGLKLKVTVRHPNDIQECVLMAHLGRQWRVVNSLLDLGRLLAEHQPQIEKGSE